MSFDKPTRNALGRMVGACRRLLTEDIKDQLQRTYSLQPDGTVLPLERLAHLDEQGRDVAGGLREWWEHLAAQEVGAETERRRAAFDRMAYETGFTLLNRLAALRMCEERGLVLECVRRGTESDGFALFEAHTGGMLGTRSQAYRAFLEQLFDELAVDLGVLFDRRVPHSLVFPGDRCLEEVLALLNTSEIAHLWKEDETIGWIYQYFNPPEERRAMREDSPAPRNSRELAVRNQFFTPRYVVEFLTDNTLGRIWYEMRKDETALKSNCRYMVRRPNEFFLKASEKVPQGDDRGEDLSQEELLKRPLHIEHRPKKDPRDLKILDPACGSGHFLLYAFDLLELIYAEAWDDPESPKSEVTGGTLREDYGTVDELRRAIPDLILRCNVHGVDIDPRCAQIAALALWLRAQKTWQAQGLKAAERPRITKSNIVTAEPMPGEADMLREFTESLRPTVLGQMVEVVFDKMKLAGQAGSLLKIEEEIKDAVAEARKQWLEGPKPEQKLLFPGMADPQPTQQELRFDFKGITDERFWQQAEERILEALKEYAERAENGYAIRRRLFAADAARGLAFIDLGRKRYDVVVMNPPFGEASSMILPYLEKRYPHWSKNLLCASISRALETLCPLGLSGVIFDRTAAIKSSYERFRTDILDPRILSVADTGWNVLDANVETTAHVLTAKDQDIHATFFDIREYEPDVRPKQLDRLICGANAGAVEKGVFVVRPKTFLRLPNAIVGYYFDAMLLSLFERWSNLSEASLQARQGHALVSDEHFRVFWELSNPADVGTNNNYATLYNGAEFSLFFSPSRDVTKYGSDGRVVGSNRSVVLRNLDYQFLSGVGYGKRGEIVDAHVLCSESIFTSEGQAITGIQRDEAKIALSFLNSSLAQYTINQYCGQHKHCGYINLLPMPFLEDSVRRDVIENAEKIVEMKRRWFGLDETTLEFGILLAGVGSWDKQDNLRDALDAVVNKLKADGSKLSERIANNDGYFKQAARLSRGESEQLDGYISRRPLDSPWPDMERDRASESVSVFLVKTLISQTIGLVCGRWDLRISMDATLAPRLADPFDPPPGCPPGMLVGPDGMPAEPGRLASEEWLRARPVANSLPEEGSVKNPTVPDADYPLQVSWDGILVDDPGFNGGQPHRDDIVRRVREVLDLLWKDKTHEIEQEVCEILGVPTLQDYFRKPSGFFQDHLRRYSKSGRKAPIYWPFSTASGSYTVWIYYHRLNDDLLYKVINDYVNPKISETERRIGQFESGLASASGRQATRLRGGLEEAMLLREELNEFKAELLRVAGLPYKPDLNDGVLITASPFWRLFRLPKWRKDLEACWKKLEAGEYDWAHLAYAIWPERVREACKRDRSIAIAHNLEHLYEPPAQGKRRYGTRRERREMRGKE